MARTSGATGRKPTDHRFVGRAVPVAAAALLTAGLAACGNETPEGNGGDDHFPSGPLRVIVASSAGGGVDTSARLMQGPVESRLGVELMFDNRPGGNYAVGATSTVQGPGDCSAVMVLGTPLLELSYLTQEVSYDGDDFAALYGATYEPGVIRTSADAPWDTFAELVEDARSQPGSIRAGVAAAADQAYLALAEIEELTGVEFNLVPYQGGAEVRNALLSGEVDFIHTPLFASIGIQSETKILAVDTEEPVFPDLTGGAETINDQLGIDSFPFGVSYGIFVHAGCLADYPERFEILEAAWLDASTDPDYQAQLAELGITEMAHPLGSDDFQAFSDEYVENMMPILESLDLLVD